MGLFCGSKCEPVRRNLNLFRRCVFYCLDSLRSSGGSKEASGSTITKTEEAVRCLIDTFMCDLAFYQLGKTIKANLDICFPMVRSSSNRFHASVS